MAAPTDRPPSILSEWGEGYCRWCFFVVGLSHDGRLAQHHRNSSYQPRQCDGSGTLPPKITPFSSRKAAFKQVAKKHPCHVCRRTVPVLSDGRLGPHAVAHHATTNCAGGYQLPRPPERDHSGERG